MIFLPISIILFIVFILLLPVLVVFVQIQFVQIAFERLGLSQNAGIAFFLFSLLGGSINIPIVKRDVPVMVPPDLRFIPFFARPRVPAVSKQILAINLGGALIPLLLCIYLIFRTPLLEVAVATAVIIVVAKLLSRPVRGIGVVLPAFIPPIVSAILAFMLAPPKSGSHRLCRGSSGHDNRGRCSESACVAEDKGPGDNKHRWSGRFRWHLPRGHYCGAAGFLDSLNSRNVILRLDRRIQGF